MEPIYSLVYAWQKIELDCWPKLLDGIEEQYELNAGKVENFVDVGTLKVPFALF